MISTRLLAVSLIITALCVALALPVVHAVQMQVVGPFVHVQYIDLVQTSKMLALQPGQRVTLQFGVPPSDAYKNYLMIVRVSKPSPALQFICTGQCTFRRTPNGLVQEVYVSSGNLTIINAGTSTYVTRLYITYVYARNIEYPLEGQVVKIILKVPDDTINEVTQQIVKLWIDNSVPYMVSKVVLPCGKTLSELAAEGYSVQGIKVEPKYVEINASKAPRGTYTVVLTYCESCTMPYVFLVKALEYLNTTVGPRCSKVVTPADFGIPRGWKLLGYVVAIAAVQPLLPGQRAGNVVVEGRLTIPVSEAAGIAAVKAVSYLIPTIMRFKYVVGTYIVYGTGFRIVNNMTVPVMVLYVPLLYKPTGQLVAVGNRTVILAPVSQLDVSNGIWTALVVQLPEYATIDKIVTPGGVTYSSVTSSLVPWGTTIRPVSISPDRHQAYIAVALRSVKEPGVYKIYITVKPLVLRVVTQTGRPLTNCTVTIQYGNVKVTEVPNEKGLVTFNLGTLVSEPIAVTVKYDNMTVSELVLNTVPCETLKIVVPLYNVTVAVTDYRGAPLAGAMVVLSSGNGEYVKIAYTNANGVATIENVPAGTYTLTVKIGSATLTKTTVDVNGNKVLKIGTNVLVVIHVGSQPIVLTTTQVLTAAAVIAAAVVAGVVLLPFIRRRRTSEETQEYIIEENSGEETETRSQ